MCTPSRLSRLRIVLLLALGMLAASLVAPATAVSHDAYSNGCGPHGNWGVNRVIPDTPYGLFAFHGPCDQHDRCYGRRIYGSGSAAKRRCDSEFLGRMLAVCYADWLSVGRLLNLCANTAEVYYDFVRRYGKI